MRRTFPILMLVAALTACDAGPKVTPKAAAPGQGEVVLANGARGDASPSVRRDDEPVRLVAGKPLWTSNRKFSSEENARSHFQRDGADFDAKTMEDYVAKAHAFTAKPPKGALKIDRPNGDVLIYEEKSNTFAVVAKSGAPRTMFKPRDGKDYWLRQVSKEKERASRD